MFRRLFTRTKDAGTSPQRRLAKVGNSGINRSLAVESLEARLLLSADGMAWATTPELTLSYAPDGTDVAGQPSSLFAEFDTPQIPGWQQSVLSAFEEWIQHTSTSITVVDDNGDPFGSSGPTSGDGRFGDIRVAAIPLSSDIIAMSVPHNEIISGTWAGDILINSDYEFSSADDLFAVMLHEAGHVLGLDHSDNPDSPMHIHGISDAVTPLAEDIAELRKVLGFTDDEKRRDRHEHDDDRDSDDEWEERSGREGKDAPSENRRDRHERDDDRDTDDEWEERKRQRGDGDEDERFDRDDDADEFDEELERNAIRVLNADADRRFHYESSGVIDSGQDVDIFRLAPNRTRGDSPKYMTITVRSTDQNGLVPHVAVFSSRGRAIETEVLANADGTLILQVENVNPRRSYLIHVMAANGEEPIQSGAYSLEAQYVAQPTELDEFFVGTLGGGKQAATNTLHVEETTLTQMVLTVDAVETEGVEMWATVYDDKGDLVDRITASPGETHSSGTLLLSPGDYRIEFHVVGPDGNELPAIPFELLGKIISLPIGPTISDPTLAPILPSQDTTGGPEYTSPPDLAVTDPVIFPSPIQISEPVQTVVVQQPWYDTGWWNWERLNVLRRTR